MGLAADAPHIIDLLEASGIGGNGRFRFEPSGTEQTAGQIWEASEQVARRLHARTGTGVRIGAFLTNTPGCPAAVLGVWRSGNTLVSLPQPGRGADLEVYVAQLTRMVELSQLQILLVDEAYQALLPSLPVPVVTFGEAAAPARTAEAVRMGQPLPAAGGDLIQFTSGSLGQPKGVLLTGQALAANVLAIMSATGIGAGERAVTWLPMSHDMGFVGMFLTGMAGMAPGIDGELVVLQTPESFLADPASWLRLCSSHRATITSAPNFAFELACRAAPFLTQIDLSSLRVCITGAERVSAPTLERFTSTFAPRGLRPEVICPAYGMAEAALAVTLVRPGETWRSLRVDRSALARGEVLAAVSEQDAVEYVSNGTILPGLEVRIMPSDAAGAGGGAQSLRVGEVQIRGESLFSGYIGADAVLTSDGWFPTRDAGFIRDGELFLAGRNDETIIVGGQNHYAADIEQALSHDLVRPGTLAAVPLVSGFALLAEPVGDPEVTALDHACRELAVRSARQAGLRPAVVGFVARGRLPKTPSGKPQRLRMAAALAQDRLPMLASVRFDPSYRQG